MSGLQNALTMKQPSVMRVASARTLTLPAKFRSSPQIHGGKKHRQNDMTMMLTSAAALLSTFLRIISCCCRCWLSSKPETLSIWILKELMCVFAVLYTDQLKNTITRNGKTIKKMEKNHCFCFIGLSIFRGRRWRPQPLLAKKIRVSYNETFYREELALWKMELVQSNWLP